MAEGSAFSSQMGLDCRESSRNLRLPIRIRTRLPQPGRSSVPFHTNTRSERALIASITKGTAMKSLATDKLASVKAPDRMRAEAGRGGLLAGWVVPQVRSQGLDDRRCTMTFREARDQEPGAGRGGARPNGRDNRIDAHRSQQDGKEGRANAREVRIPQRKDRPANTSTLRGTALVVARMRRQPTITHHSTPFTRTTPSLNPRP